MEELMEEFEYPFMDELKDEPTGELTEVNLEYPMDQCAEINIGMTIMTRTGDYKVIKYGGWDVYYLSRGGKKIKGYAPDSDPDAYEFRRHKIFGKKV
jgi:hypothetical protein